MRVQRSTGPLSLLLLPIPINIVYVSRSFAIKIMYPLVRLRLLNPLSNQHASAFDKILFFRPRVVLRSRVIKKTSHFDYIIINVE